MIIKDNSIGPFAGLSALSVVSTLLATPVTATAQASLSSACDSTSIQELCAESCSTLCESNVNFLASHPDFCNNHLQNDASSSAADHSVCKKLISGSESGSEGTAVETTTPTPIVETKRDCSQYEKRSEQIRCEREDRPTCSATAVELEADARLLVTEVRHELEQYGELLTEDLTGLESRQALCKFSLDYLDQSYSRAKTEPDNLRIIQQRSRLIQDCRVEWEDYLRNTAASTENNDNLPNKIAADVKKQFEPLVDQLQNLSASINKLNEAEKTIDGLIGIHIDFCAPGGTPLKPEGQTTQ